MARRPSRTKQWISRSPKVVVPGLPDPVHITIAAARQALAQITFPQAPLILAWAIAGALVLAAKPAALVRRRGREVSIRLDRLASQLQVQLESEVTLSHDERLDLWQKALVLGASAELEDQKKALALFKAEVVAYRFSPLRIVLNHVDLSRLGPCIDASPFQFVLQVHMLGTAHLIREAPPQPRGRPPAEAGAARLMGFLARVADEALRAGGHHAQSLRVAARQAGYINPGHLELVYFAVDHALPWYLGHDLRVLDTEYRSFARDYLYPNRSRWRDYVRALLAIPGAFERLIALGITAKKRS